MLGAYVGAFALGLTGNFWLALLAVPLVVGALGMLTERFLVRPLYGRGIDYPLLLTFGLGLILVEACASSSAPRASRSRRRDVAAAARPTSASVFFPTYRLFLIVVTALVLLALWLFLEKTPYGLIIRAGARDPEIVRVLGVDVARVWLHGVRRRHRARRARRRSGRADRAASFPRWASRSWSTPSSSRWSAAWARCWAPSSPACSSASS